MFLEARTSQIVEIYFKFSSKILLLLFVGFTEYKLSRSEPQDKHFVGEIIFAKAIAIAGLVLSLIGDMQKYLQSTTVRV